MTEVGGFLFGVCLLGVLISESYWQLDAKKARIALLIPLMAIAVTGFAFISSLPWRPLQWDNQRMFFLTALAVAAPLVWQMLFERISGSRGLFYPNALGAFALFGVVLVLGYQEISYGQIISFFLSALTVVLVWEGLIGRLCRGELWSADRGGAMLAIGVTLVITVLSFLVGMAYGGTRWVS